MTPLRPIAPTAAAALVTALLFGACSMPAERREPGPRLPLSYPATRSVDQTDDYHGTRVADPYRWLEDLDAPETASWVAAQNAVATPFLEAIPRRDAILARLRELWNYERYDVPVTAGGRIFYLRNDGLQDQDVLYVSDGEGSGPRVLIDPNTFSEDRTTSMRTFAVSRDGAKIAYSISEGGSDWRVWKVRDVGTGADLEDTLDAIKFTNVSWSIDGKGFFYSRYPRDERGRGDGSKQVAIHYHRIGTPQSKDPLVYAITDHPTRNPYGQVTDDGRYLIIHVYEGTQTNGIYYRSLAEPGARVVRLLDHWDALYFFLGNRDGVFYFMTNKGGPRSRVIAIDVANPAPANWREVVPEAEETLEAASLVGGRLIARYLKDANSVIRVFGADGSAAGEVELPGLGTVDGFAGRIDDEVTFYSYESFTTPGRIYRYEIASGRSTLFREADVSADLGGFETRQVFYASGDGTRIPMFLVHRKGIARGGDNPTLLYGYGGFNASETPVYRTRWIAWLEMGGVLAIANLRGGGEYGEAWHLAGTKVNKQNVFDDFIAAAEWLIEQKYTSPRRLAIFGRSNGGLLVAAVLNQRPDLFGAALPAVGVLDMLRYHTASANARQWSSDYGLSENQEEFRALFAYSPYHNVRQGACYPPTLITTADHDDRVAPWHSFKYAAALQKAQGCENPILIRIETRAGHGAGKPTWMQIEDFADQWAFLAWALGMKG